MAQIRGLSPQKAHRWAPPQDGVRRNGVGGGGEPKPQRFTVFQEEPLFFPPSSAVSEEAWEELCRS